MDIREGLKPPVRDLLEVFSVKQLKSLTTFIVLVSGGFSGESGDHREFVCELVDEIARELKN